MHSNNVVHFAIYADDLDRAKSFYTSVFHWKFEEWGPPDFYLITTGSEKDRGIRGALQKRMNTVAGEGVIGYECSISVADVKSISSAIVESGGQIVTKEVEIPTVGRLVKFQDTEGNIAIAIQYASGVDV